MRYSTIDHIKAFKKMNLKLEMLRNCPCPQDEPSEIIQLKSVIKTYERIYKLKPKEIFDFTPKSKKKSLSTRERNEYRARI